jgi:hypothetical protein
MHSIVNIMIEVDSAEADGNQWDCQASWVWKLRPTPIYPRHRTIVKLSPTAAVAIHNLIRRAIFDMYRHTRSHRRPYHYWSSSKTPLRTRERKISAAISNNYGSARGPRNFSDRLVTLWTYAGQRWVKEHNKEVTPEDMPNYISITIHLRLSPSSKDTIPSFSLVAVDII